MRLEIKNHPAPQATSVKVFLAYGNDGGIDIMAVDEDNDGRVWNILTLTGEGRLDRAGNIPDELGFEVDTRGRILFEGEPNV